MKGSTYSRDKMQDIVQSADNIQYWIQHIDDAHL